MKLLICAVTIINMSLVAMNSSLPTPSSTTQTSTTPSCPRLKQDGVWLEPQNRECMVTCHPRKQKRINWVCGEEDNPSKDGGSTFALYINECERFCDNAKSVDQKMCKNLNKQYKAGQGQRDRDDRWDCEEE